MSVRTGMYHFEVSRTALYQVRYVLARTSAYHLVLPYTRCTGFQMDFLVHYIIISQGLSFGWSGSNSSSFPPQFPSDVASFHRRFPRDSSFQVDRLQFIG